MATDQASHEEISLQTLKDRAKALRRNARVGESDAQKRIRPYFDDPSTLKLQQAQLVIAREHGFKSWRRLKSFIELRDARTEAQRELASISTRMEPMESLMDEYRAAIRRIDRLTNRLLKSRPDLPGQPSVLQPDASPASSALHELLRCSFCFKSQHEAPKLIAGPGVFICNECVVLCTRILESAPSS